MVIRNQRQISMLQLKPQSTLVSLVNGFNLGLITSVSKLNEGHDYDLCMSWRECFNDVSQSLYKTVNIYCWYWESERENEKGHFCFYSSTTHKNQSIKHGRWFDTLPDDKRDPLPLPADDRRLVLTSIPCLRLEKEISAPRMQAFHTTHKSIIILVRSFRAPNDLTSLTKGRMYWT